MFLRLKFTVFIGLASISMLISQTQKQSEMEKLNFLVGNWVGTSTSYKNDTIVKQVPAYEEISLKVDNSILTIDLHSETLKLHTIVYYDKEKKTYYYNPYYKEGTGKYPAKLVNGKLIVSPNKKKRFIFEITPEGKFREYGEKLVDGIWIKYFEDIFIYSK